MNSGGDRWWAASEAKFSSAIEREGTLCLKVGHRTFVHYDKSGSLSSTASFTHGTCCRSC